MESSVADRCSRLQLALVAATAMLALGGGCKHMRYHLETGGGAMFVAGEGSRGNAFTPGAGWTAGAAFLYYLGDKPGGKRPSSLGIMYHHEFMGSWQPNVVGSSSVWTQTFSFLNGLGLKYSFNDLVVVDIVPEFGPQALTFVDAKGWANAFTYGVSTSAELHVPDSAVFFRLRLRLQQASHELGSFVFIPVWATVGVELH